MTDEAPQGPLSPEQLKAHILAALDTHPAVTPRTTGALIAVVNGDHLQIAVATRLDAWTVELQATYPWSGHPRLDLTVRTTW